MPKANEIFQFFFKVKNNNNNNYTKQSTINYHAINYIDKIVKVLDNKVINEIHDQQTNDRIFIFIVTFVIKFALVTRELI